MEGFAHEWLRLREPVDHESRSTRLQERLQAEFGTERSLQILDLGAGSGSNLRYLGPRLLNPQSWMLIDYDASLLVHAAAPCRKTWVCSCTLDLNEWDRIQRLPRPDLVTGSALLDLVSADWLKTLVDQCLQWRAVVLFGLTVNGEIALRPADPDDATVLKALQMHQRRHKGLGQALGPDAASRLAETLRDAGYQVWMEPSPWALGPQNQRLAAELVYGWASAATEQDPSQSLLFQSWQHRRMRQITDGELEIDVGHWDLLALPPAQP
jgi:hypothetical protein